MNAKQLGLEAMLLGFSALTAYAVYQHGYIGFFELLLANVATVTAFVDLSIALSLILMWMWRDACERGVSFLPYLALTFALGSVGPLLYLIRRVGSEHIGPVRVAPRQVHS
ncbi:MAG: DUF2834 domain-containing protein [Candidatus Binatia bacterium]